MFEAILMLMLFEPNTQTEVLRDAPPTLAAPAPSGPSQRSTAPGTAPPVISAPTQAGDANLARADREHNATPAPAPARRWSWLFEHGSRHHGTLAPRFELDTRHVF